MVHGGSIARRITGVAAVVVVIGATVVALSPPVVAAPMCPAAAADARTATAAAVGCGGRVEAMAERTEEAQTFANSDGSFTMVQSLLPRFARRTDGSWTAADATLRVSADGSLAPAAPVFPMAFSGGGDGPLATMTRDGARLEVSWPTPLPKPTVSGSIATYANVPVSGVDLQVRAGVAGFSTVFVVKTRAAGADPSLASLRFGLAARGLRVSADAASGAVRAVDRAGRVVFAAGTPLMWDSSRGSKPGAPGAVAAPGVVGDPASAEPRVAPMAVRLQSGAVTVTPDRAMLSDPKTEYPVYIDPPWTGYRQNWTLVRKTFPTSSYWNTTSSASDDSWAGAVKVGFEDFESPSMTDRSLFQMRTDGVKGKVIDSAHFKLWQLWASRGCGGTGGVAHLWTTGAISASTTWNQQPAWSTRLSGTTAVHRYDESGSCGPAEIAFDVRTQVQTAANANANSINLGLRAQDETDRWTWKRYQLTGDHAPRLEITYRSRPSVPDQLSSSGQPCLTGAARPLAAAPATLSARVLDADGGNVTATFQHAVVNTDGTYGAWTAAPPSTKPSGQPASATLSSLTHGQAYAWRVMATDPSTLTSDWSTVCEFVASTTGPASPTVSSSDYPEAPGDCVGGPGRTGTFQFTPNSSVVTSYIYRWNDGPATTVTVAAGAPLTVKLTPPPPDPLRARDGGESHLHVSTRNSAGQPSTGEYDYLTWLCDAAGEAGRWSMVEGSGTTLADASGNGHDAAFAAGTWTAAANQHVPSDAAISLAGTASAATVGPVVDTSVSYTVSAWARLSATSSAPTVVAQNGANASAFQLHYGQSANAWCFTARASDAAAAAATSACAVTPKLGVWTHLVGVYDAGGVGDPTGGRLRLYVNGNRVSEATYTASWNGTGVVSIGRRIVGGAGSDQFAGDVDEVRMWPRVLTDLEVRGMAARLAGAWGFEEGPDVSYDASGYGRDAEWTNAWGTPPFTAQVDGHSVELGMTDGSSYAVAVNPPHSNWDYVGRVGTGTPAIRTDQSFTVSAWAKLTATTTTNGFVVTQAWCSGSLGGCFPSTSESATFSLFWSTAANKWQFAVTKADRSGTFTATSNSTVTVGVWYRLIGVYDAQAAEVRLYVGQATNAPTQQTAKATGVTTPLASTKPLRMGTGPSAFDNLSGTVDDVAVFAGVLPNSVITNPSDPLWRIWS
jgi:hypothetical protein